jgi:hypothetical protein
VRALQLFQRIKQEAIFWLARRLPTCKEIAPRMSESLDRRLSLGERVTLNLHLHICIWCVRYMEQIRSLRRISSHYDAALIENSIASTEQSLSPESRERLNRALQQKNQ